MARKQFDFKKEWPKIREQLINVSQEALTLAKKGEGELVKFSQQSKLHIDATALNLKKEHLFHLIGKEYIKAKAPGPQTQRLKDLLAEFDALEKQQRLLKRKIKISPPGKKTASKSRKKAASKTAAKKSQSAS